MLTTHIISVSDLYPQIIIIHLSSLKGVILLCDKTCSFWWWWGGGVHCVLLLPWLTSGSVQCPVMVNLNGHCFRVANNGSHCQIMSRPGLCKCCILLSTRQITAQQILSIRKTNCTIQWIEIYPPFKQPGPDVSDLMAVAACRLS